MSNSIFDWPASLRRFVRFTTAKSDEVNAAFDQLSAGLDTVEADIRRSLKLPTGTADQTLAMPSGMRAGLLLGFDANGNVTAIAGGGRYRGDWLTATAYATADYFRDPATKNIYAVVVAHTSTTVAADLAAGNIRLAIDVADVEAQRVQAQAAATTATTQAGTATTQAGIATSASSTAVSARDAAIAARDAAELSFDSFDDRYLGPKAANPTVDNDGNALLVGALHWNTTAQEMRVWNGSAWTAAYLPASNYALLTRPYTDIGTNTNAVRFTRYRITAALDLTLPPTPSDGDWIEVSNTSTSTAAWVRRNGQNIGGLAEDMQINDAPSFFTLIFRAGYGWIVRG